MRQDHKRSNNKKSYFPIIVDKLKFELTQPLNLLP
jgi:hypothetical protein